MVQRALISACLIIALVSLSLLGLVWHQSNQAVIAATDATRRLADAQAASQAKLVELLTHSQSTDAAMLKHLQSMANAAQAPQSPDWVSVSFKLTLETVDGPPAPGYEATLLSGSSGVFDQGIRRESDADGLVDFGVVHPGDWQFLLSKAWDNDHKWKCEGNINVLPGTKLVKTIVCPKPAPEQVQCQVQLRVQWPADLADKDLRVLATFEQAPTTLQPPLKWSIVDSAESLQTRSVMIGPGLKQIEIGGQTTLNLWCAAQTTQDFERFFGDFRSPSVQSEPVAIGIQAGTFFLRRLIVLKPRTQPKKAMNRERSEVLAHTDRKDPFVALVNGYSSDPNDGKKPYSTFSLNFFEKRAVTLSPSCWSELDARFLARPGHVDEWMLEMPAEIVNVVRETLANKQDPKAQIASPLTPLGVDLR
jgi:hypothetical protein